jgi:hypothetical protein
MGTNKAPWMEKENEHLKAFVAQGVSIFGRPVHLTAPFQASVIKRESSEGRSLR